MRNSATILPVASAIWAMAALAVSGILLRLLPPVTIRKTLFVFRTFGLTTMSQCSQTGRSTSFSVRHACDVSLIMVVVVALASFVLATLHLNSGSGFWM